MLKSWTGIGPHDSHTINSLASDTMGLSLEVIGRAGLGQKLGWLKATESLQQNLPTGHRMSLTEAIQLLLRNMLYVIALPMWFLSECELGARIGTLLTLPRQSTF